MSSRRFLHPSPPPPVHHHVHRNNSSSNQHRPFGGEHSHPAVAMSSTATSSRSSVALMLAFAIAGGITCLVVIFLSAIIVYNKFKTSPTRTSPFDPAAPLRLQKFSYRQLKSATSSFSNESKLGQGGFGPVYKGLLRNGLVVAVKNLDSASLQGEREFQNELCVIGGIRSPHIVGLIGFCAERKRRLLVYEFMARRSLQEALFDEEYPASLDWKMRFGIIMDIAQALAFLHVGCEPAIIHGDLKPSNILLDEDFRAKIADFGLARNKAEVAAGSDIRSEEVDRESSLDLRDHKNRRKKRHVVEDTPVPPPQVADVEAGKSSDVDSAFSFHCECPGGDIPIVETTGCWKIESKRLDEADVCWNTPGNVEVDHHSLDGDNHPEDIPSPDGNVQRPVEVKRGSRDWNWRKNENVNNDDAIVKDYTVDWLACEVKRGSSRSRDWTCRDDPHPATTATTGNNNKGQFQLRDWLRNSTSDNAGPSPACCGFGGGDFSSLKDRVFWRKTKLQQEQRRREKSRTEFSGNLTKSREWWKEEYIEELSNKSRELKGERCRKHGPQRSRDMSWSFDFSGDLSNKQPREWWSGDILHWIHRSRGDSGDFSGDLNAHRDRTWSRDRWSGELTSRAMSSTTSMRGTVCYVAPEYGGGGILSEKSDVYSFGVLMLVIISGRRPLQVVSPSVEFERVNLTTWARHLAHNGDVLDLVDPSLRGEFVKEQARDCIMLALQCLQRIPAVRPSMADVVRILSGESQLTVSLPELFSPSPPPGSSPRFGTGQWRHQAPSEHAGEHPLLAD